MRSSRTPSLLGLRAFEAAARRLSFTDAARELHVSQAAISRHVRALEKQLGRPMFRRLHRRVELTAPGTQLAQELGVGFAQITRAVEMAQRIGTRQLRVAVEPAFAARWLVPRLGGFSNSYPQVELELESSDAMRVLGRDTDIAIRFLGASVRRPRGRARKLCTLEIFPVIAGGLLAKGKPRDDGDAAVAHYRLLHDDDGSSWRAWFTAAGLAGYEQAKHLHFNDYSLVLTAVLRGQGVALSAPIYNRAELNDGRLVRLGRTSVTSGDYWLLEAAGRASAKARAAFMAWLDTESQKLLPA